MALCLAGSVYDRTVKCALLVTLLCKMTSIAHKCNHQYPGIHEVRHTYLEAHHVIKKRTADQSIRIYVWYDGSVNDLESPKRNLIKNELIPQAIDYFSNAFQVKPTGVPIRLSRTCSNSYQMLPGEPYEYCTDTCAEETTCGYVTVPQQHLQHCRVCTYVDGKRNCGLSSTSTEGQGVDGYDFILYVTALQTETCGYDDTIGFATWCQLETALDRPVAGFANLCPESLSLQEAHFNNILGSLKHEIYHALGFSASLYAFYRDSDGQPLTDRSADGKPPRNYESNMYEWSDRVVQTVKRVDWDTRNGPVEHNVQMLVTPKVTREVRRHFDCELLEGIEIENQGGSGSELSHFEKRLLENEAMTGIHSQTRVFSRISLALMEDTGWYVCNYDMAEPLLWGKDLGCDFVKKSCKTWIDIRKSQDEETEPFCDTVSSVEFKLQCNIDRSSVALCNIHKYDTELPAEFQYFSYLDGVESTDLGKYGGVVEMADYCPYHQELEWESDSDIIRTSHCNNPNNAPDSRYSFSLEHYGDSAVCVEQGVAWIKQQCNLISTQHQWGSGCYKHFCDADRGLVLQLGDEEYQCFYKDQILFIRIEHNDALHEGSLVCPSCQEVCGDQIVCPVEELNPPPDNRTSKVYVIPCVAGATMISDSLFSSIFRTILLIFLMVIL